MNNQITSFMLQGSAWQGMVWLGKARLSIARFGMVGQGTARHGMVLLRPSVWVFVMLNG